MTDVDNVLWEESLDAASIVNLRNIALAGGVVAFVVLLSLSGNGTYILLVVGGVQRGKKTLTVTDLLDTLLKKSLTMKLVMISRN